VIDSSSILFMHEDFTRVCVRLCLFAVPVGGATSQQVDKDVLLLRGAPEAEALRVVEAELLCSGTVEYPAGGAAEANAREAGGRFVFTFYGAEHRGALALRSLLTHTKCSDDHLLGRHHHLQHAQGYANGAVSLEGGFEAGEPDTGTADGCATSVWASAGTGRLIVIDPGVLCSTGSTHAPDTSSTSARFG